VCGGVQRHVDLRFESVVSRADDAVEAGPITLECFGARRVGMPAAK
jgi:hypothetical protein